MQVWEPYEVAFDLLVTVTAVFGVEVGQYGLPESEGITEFVEEQTAISDEEVVYD